MPARDFKIPISFAQVAIAIASVALASTAVADTTIFKDGRLLLPIYVAADCGPEEHEAALELERVIGVMSGISAYVRAEDPAGGDGFYVGRTLALARHMSPLVLATDWLTPLPREVGPDAFRIRTIGGSIYIEGATPEASYFAVSWLLQKNAGVRWFAPGAEGELIPHPGMWSLPDLNLIRGPAYLSRELSGFDSPEGVAWARHNGLKGRLQFSHGLSRVFPPELFAAHPDWFPLLGGRRYRPVSASDRDWQPNLSLPAVADHASRAVLDAFSNETRTFSFSLGINDTMRFDQSPATRQLVEPLEYFRGMPDYSSLVFTFLNRAAAPVSRVAAGRYIGCLAYFWCENPPPFPVQSNIIPYLTSDRTQYYDPNFRADDLDLMSRWGTSGVKAFGIWEYAYGSGFVVPREPVGALADAIREAFKRGARGYFGEVGLNQKFDAFKTWAIAQLLWDPELSISGLEDEFFSGYYGPAGAPMRRFFKECQAQWMGQGGLPFWLKYYGQEDQALVFPAETCGRLRAILAEAVRLAAADGFFATRVELVSRAFGVTEAYVAYDTERRELAAADGFPGGENALSKAIGRLAGARTRLDSALLDASNIGQEAMEATLPASLLRNDPVPRLLFGAGIRDPSAPRRILDTAGSAASTWIPWRALSDGLAGRLCAAPNLAANSSFLESAAEGQEPHFLYSRFGVLPAKWKLSAMPTERGRAMLVDEVGGNDKNSHRRSIRIEGAWDTQFYQWFPAKPGYAYLATARLRGRSSPGGDAMLFLTFLSANGHVAGAATQSLPKGETPAWRIEALCDLAPPHSEWIGIGIGCARQTLGDWMEGNSVEMRCADGATSP